MKILGISFSSRQNGNCEKFTEYCLEEFQNKNYETEAINLYNYNISPCRDCGYACFFSKCPKQDDMDKLISRCIKSDIIILSLPTYRGHLSSAYFTFSERLQGYFKTDKNYEDDFLKKINLIVTGNLSSGGDMALHEALYEFSNRTFYPETILFSSRDYDRKSINGDLIEDELVKGRLDKFIEKISKKSRI
ncbi:MAG: flavodoxin family protein [Bacillota bacterium]|nr:flavodoxin family protein [Bacillota bacterium]